MLVVTFLVLLLSLLMLNSFRKGEMDLQGIFLAGGLLLLLLSVNALGFVPNNTSSIYQRISVVKHTIHRVTSISLSGAANDVRNGLTRGVDQLKRVPESIRIEGASSLKVADKVLE